MVSDQQKPSAADAKRRDELLLRLLKTPPQPRPHRERPKAEAPAEPKKGKPSPKKGRASKNS